MDNVTVQPSRGRRLEGIVGTFRFFASRIYDLRICRGTQEASMGRGCLSRLAKTDTTPEGSLHGRLQRSLSLPIQFMRLDISVTMTVVLCNSDHFRINVGVIGLDVFDERFCLPEERAGAFPGN